MKSVYFVIFFIFLVQQINFANCSDENVNLKFTPRIIGGRRARKGEFLGIVSIQTWQSQHFCGGTWFKFENKMQVLTAAHCVMDKNRNQLDKSLLQVMGNDLSVSPYGSASRQVRKIRKIVPHPYYNPDKLANDIAIIFLENQFEEKEKEFAPLELTDRAIFDSQHCNVAGWGYLVEGGAFKTSELMATNVTVISRYTCNLSYKGRVGRHSFCAGLLEGGKDTCQGDSGGGLLYKNNIVGIVSSGIGCGQPLFPGIYTNVHHYKHWIRQVMNSTSHSIPTPLLILAGILAIVLHYINF